MMDLFLSEDSSLETQLLSLFKVLRAQRHVLLSDVDVLWLQNPFTLPSLYRDADVEGMTDGWDDVTAYGYHWRSGGGRSRLAATLNGKSPALSGLPKLSVAVTVIGPNGSESTAALM